MSKESFKEDYEKAYMNEREMRVAGFKLRQEMEEKELRFILRVSL